jgi:Domain of unknown function (DUF4440)
MKLRNLIPFALAALLCGPVCAHAQVPDKPDQLRTLTRDELDIVKVLTQQERAWNDGDLDSFVKGYKASPDTIIVGDHVTRGYGDVLLDYKKNFPTKEALGTLTFSELEPHILDERFAIVTGRYRLDRNKKAGGPAEGLFSDVFEKTDKGWKIILNHTT